MDGAADTDVVMEDTDVVGEDTVEDGEDAVMVVGVTAGATVADGADIDVDGEDTVGGAK